MLRTHSSSNIKYNNIYQNTSNSYYLTFKSPIQREKTQNNENKNKNNSFFIPNTNRINLTKKNYLKKSFSSEICPKNLFYEPLCEKCFNSKQNLLKKQRYELKRENQKEKLNNSMSSANPNIFNDEMIAYEKLNIKNKIRNRQLLTKKVSSILQNYINKNPSKKEKYQNQSCYTSNSLKLGKKDLRYEKILKRYDIIQNNIQKNINKYNFDIPRKGIRDYYSKCIYDVPKMEPNNITPIDVQKNLCSYLKMQIKDKEELKKKEKETERKNHLKSIELNDYNVNYNNNIENEEKQQLINELLNDNQQILNFKNKMKKNKEDEIKYYENKLKNRIKKENENDYYNKLNKKKKDIENLKNWLEKSLEEKKRKKKIEDEENKKWNKFQNDLYNNYNKCLHNCDVEKCSYCNHITPQEELYHVYKNRNRYKRNGTNLYKFNGMF